MSLRGKFIREKQRIEGEFESREPVLKKFYAVMGDGAGNLYPNPDDDTYIYIRRTGRGRIERCRNTRIKSVHGLHVIVGYAPERPDEMQVLERDDAAHGMDSGGMSYVKNHHPQHELFNELGGDDTVWVYTQQFLYLLAQPTDPISEYIDIRAGIYTFQEQRRIFPGGRTGDMTAYDPGVANQAVMVLISIDAQSGTIRYDVSATFSTGLAESMRPAMVPASAYGTLPVAAVYVPNGATTFNWYINNERYIYDWRVFINVIGDAQGHSILSGTHIDSSPEDLVRGDMLVVGAGATPLLERVAIGAAHQIWKVNAGATDPEWDAFDWDDISAAVGADMIHDHSVGAEGGQLDWDTVWGDAVHDHSNAAEGGQLDWDVVWSDAVHNHSTAAEGGGLEIGVTDTDSTQGYVFFAGVNGVLQSDDEFYWDNTLKHLGIGAVPGNNHLYVYDNALNTTDTFNGIHSYHIKTAGALDGTEDFAGLNVYFEFDQGDGCDYLYGGRVENVLTSGDANYWYGLDVRLTGGVYLGEVFYDAVGLNVDVDLDGGTIDEDFFGLRVYANTVGGMNLLGDAFGGYIGFANYSGCTGTGYLLYLDDIANIDWLIFQSGSAPTSLGGILYLADDLYVDGDAYFGGDLISDGDVDTYIDLTGTADQIAVYAGGVHMIDIVEGATDYVGFPAGLMYLNEDSNTGMTIGITINQGANDDEILAFKSSDVAHGGTSYTETDTYLDFRKDSGVAGGGLIRGFRDSDGSNSGALHFQGWLAEDVDTTKTTAGNGIVIISSYQLSGASVGNTVANGNLLTLRTWRGGGLATVSIWDEDGDYYYDGALNNYDNENDGLAAWDLSHVLSGAWDKIMHYNADMLEAMGVIGPADENGRRMVSNKRMNALQLGAIGQGYFDRLSLWEVIGRLQNQCALYERILMDAGLLSDGGM